MVSDFLKSKHSESIKCAECYRCLVLTFIDNQNWCTVKTSRNKSVPKPKTVFSILLRSLSVPRTLRIRNFHRIKYSLCGRKLTNYAFSYTCYLPDPDTRWSRDYDGKLQEIGSSKLHQIISSPDMKCRISFNLMTEKEWITHCSVSWMCTARMRPYIT